MNGILVCPWIDIRQPIEIGDLTLLPLAQAVERVDPSLRRSVILATSYFYRRGHRDAGTATARVQLCAQRGQRSGDGTGRTRTETAIRRVPDGRSPSQQECLGVGDIWSQDKLALFLAFFVPGFLAITIYGLFVPGRSTDFVKRLPEAVGYSALHYAATLWIVLVAGLTPYGWLHIAAAYVVVFLLPVFWSPLILRLRDPERYRAIFSKNVFKLLQTPEQTAWDRLFPAEPAPAERWIRITKGKGDEQVFVGGIYTTGALVSKTPYERSIYISEQWSFDEDGEFEAQNVGGVLVTITADDVVELSSV